MLLAEELGVLCNNPDSERYGLPCPARLFTRTDHLSNEQMARRFRLSRRTIIRWRQEELPKVIECPRLCTGCRRHSALLERHARNVRRGEARHAAGAESDAGDDG